MKLIPISIESDATADAWSGEIGKGFYLVILFLYLIYKCDQDLQFMVTNINTRQLVDKQYWPLLNSLFLRCDRNLRYMNPWILRGLDGKSSLKLAVKGD